MGFNAGVTGPRIARRMPSPPDRPSSSRLVGILLMCVAISCFAGLDATAKWLNRSIDPIHTVWARYVASVILVSLFINPISRPGVARTARPWMQAFRSLLLFLSTLFNFIALKYMPMADVLAITFGVPLVVALLARPILGETLSPGRLAAIVVGFLGVLVVVRPSGGMHPAAFVAIAGVFAYATYGITTRILAGVDSSSTTMFYSGFAGFILLAPVVPFIPLGSSEPIIFVLMALMGLLGGLGHWLVILAHARAPAAVLSPFIYTQIVTVTFLGYVIFGEVPDRWTIMGSGIIIAAGLFLILSERRGGG